MHLVIVESPSKARRIQLLLGKGYDVVATGGAVRDIAGDGLGIAVLAGNQVEPAYQMVIDPTRRDRLLASAHDAQRIILATNPDREGEATAWHLTHLIGPHLYHRARLSALTPEAIAAACAGDGGTINHGLVGAQQVRRCLDRVVGWVASRVVSQHLGEARSAGRVQSVALRILAEREINVRAHAPNRCWRLEPQISLPGGPTVQGDLISIGALSADAACADEASVQATMNAVRGRTLTVTGTTTVGRTVPAPDLYSTATIQQAASVQLGLDPSDTMRALHTLFDDGRITYPYTQATTCCATVANRMRAWLGTQPAWSKHLAATARCVTADDAPEGIRPSDLMHLPQEEQEVDDVASQIYTLIWRRTVASQLADGVDRLVEIQLASDLQPAIAVRIRTVARHRAGWRVCVPDAGEPLPVILPDLPVGTACQVAEWRLHAWNSKAPPRFTPARLIQRLDADGVGRPSSLSRVISVLLERRYVTMLDRTIQVTDSGLRLAEFLGRAFGSSFADTGYTARLEADLDRVERGEEAWAPVFLRYAQAIIDDALRMGMADNPLAPRPGGRPAEARAQADLPCPVCGAAMRVIQGKYGPFRVCSIRTCGGRRRADGSIPRSAHTTATALAS